MVGLLWLYKPTELAPKAKQKGGQTMSEQEKTVEQKLTEAFDALPDSKKEFFLGFAEGVAAMKANQK